MVLPSPRSLGTSPRILARAARPRGVREPGQEVNCLTVTREPLSLWLPPGLPHSLAVRAVDEMLEAHFYCRSRQFPIVPHGRLRYSLRNSDFAVQTDGQVASLHRRSSIEPKAKFQEDREQRRNESCCKKSNDTLWGRRCHGDGVDMEDRGQDEEEGLWGHSSVGVGSEVGPGGQASRWRQAGGDLGGWSGQDAETGGGGDLGAGGDFGAEGDLGGGGDLGAGGRWQDLASVDCDERDGDGGSRLDSGIFSECPSTASPAPLSTSPVPLFSLRDRSAFKKRTLSTCSTSTAASLRKISTSSTSVLDRLDSLSSKLSGLGIPAPQCPRREEREEKAALMAKLTNFLAKHTSHQSNTQD